MADGQLFAKKIDDRPYISDFINVYGAGVLARRCLSEPVNIYDSEVQKELQIKLVAPIVPERPFYNQYPPLMFLIFLPLSLFQMPQAWIAWVIFSAIAAIAAITTTVLPLFQSKFSKAFVLCSFFASYPTWLSFRLGQTSLLLFPLLLFFWFFIKKRRYVAASCIASVMMIKLQYLPMILAIGAATGGLQFLTGLAVSSAFLLGLATMVVGWSNIIQFPNAILSHEVSSQVSGVSPEMMQNLRGIMVLIFGSDTGIAHVVVGAVALLVAAITFVAWKKIDHTAPHRFEILAAITTLMMLLFSPHTHIQDYIIASIACIWFYAVSAQKDAQFTARERRQLISLALLFPPVSWIFFVAMPLFHFVKIQPFAIFGLASITIAANALFIGKQRKAE